MSNNRNNDSSSQHDVMMGTNDASDEYSGERDYGFSESPGEVSNGPSA